jgi:glycosyltransferase involved in cell wall biosynthesis
MKIANILINPEKNFFNDMTAEKAFVDYALYLTKREAQVLSIFECNENYREATIEASSRVLEVKSNSFFKFFNVFKTWLKFIEFSPQIVLCHSIKSLRFAKLARVFNSKPFAIIGISNNNNHLKFVGADYIIVRNSSFVKDLTNFGIKRDNIFVINNSIEIEKNFQTLKRQPFFKPIRIGSIGFITPNKNFDKVLRAMVVLRSRGIDSSYKILGSGNHEDNLNILAIDLRLEKNFKILDWQTDKRNFFQEIDICIMPFGNDLNYDFILEPMLYSMPMIVSNSPTWEEIVENNINGIKIDNSDDSQIATKISDAIEKLINNENEAIQYGKRANEKIIDHFSAEIISNRVYQICKNICDLV